MCISGIVIGVQQDVNLTPILSPSASLLQAVTSLFNIIQEATLKAEVWGRTCALDQQSGSQHPLLMFLLKANYSQQCPFVCVQEVVLNTKGVVLNSRGAAQSCGGGASVFLAARQQASGGARWARAAGRQRLIHPSASARHAACSFSKSASGARRSGAERPVLPDAGKHAAQAAGLG